MALVSWTPLVIDYFYTVKALIYSLLTLLVLSQSSCGSREQDLTPVPEGILSKEEFRDVLIQLSLAESSINLNFQNVIPAKLDSTYPFNPLKDLNIRKSLFDSSLHFYTAHPVIYRTVYDSVLARLNDLRFSREKLKNDSLLK